MSSCVERSIPAVESRLDSETRTRDKCTKLQSSLKWKLGVRESMGIWAPGGQVDADIGFCLDIQLLSLSAHCKSRFFS